MQTFSLLPSSRQSPAGDRLRGLFGSLSGIRHGATQATTLAAILNAGSLAMPLIPAINTAERAIILVIDSGTAVTSATPSRERRPATVPARPFRAPGHHSHSQSFPTP